MPDEEKQEESHEEHEGRLRDIENAKISLKSLWKIIAAVAVIISAWVSLQLTVNHVHNEVTELQKISKENSATLESMKWVQKANQSTMCAILNEMGKSTGQGYYLVPDTTTLYDISQHLQVSVPILLRYNDIVDQIQ